MVQGLNDDLERLEATRRRNDQVKHVPSHRETEIAMLRKRVQTLESNERMRGFPYRDDKEEHESLYDDSKYNDMERTLNERRRRSWEQMQRWERNRRNSAEKSKKQRRSW